MRKVDKLKQIQKANILAEQRFMESKGFISEAGAETGDFSSYDAGDTAQSYADDGKADLEREDNRRNKLNGLMGKMNSVGVEEFFSTADMDTLFFLLQEYAMPLDEIERNIEGIKEGLLNQAKKHSIKASDFVSIFMILNSELEKEVIGNQELVMYLKRVFKV